ncbi:1-phosphofructokinase [Clostridium thermarum]|uniref:1-phosphofructokinase n=1 Tax=Clostridium thermarum TaxID=1716543 RepID=UPI00112486E9|nr:1-phosphofructokinase [Clostridium thermarum]
MIITVTLNPAVDKTIKIDNFTPGNVNRVSEMRFDAGGKGINVSKVIDVLGGKSLATGILAGSTGNYIKEYLNSLNIENQFIFINGETRTNTKIVDSVNKANTDINEPGPVVGEADIEKVRTVIQEKLHPGSIAVFSGSVPAGVPKDIYRQLIALAKEKGAKTILDADGELLKYGMEAGPYLVKPNIHELERVFGSKIESMDEAILLSKQIKKEYGIKVLVVSLGEKGALFLNDDATILAEGIKVQPISTVGAGDSMVAALAYSLDKGYSFEDSIRLAVASGTANVMTSGTQPAELSAIREFEKQVKFKYVDNIG